MAIHAPAGQSRLVLVAEAFTASKTIYTPPKGYKLVVKGWNLTVSGASAAIAMRFGTTGNEYFASRPADASATTAPQQWRREEVRFVGAVDQPLYFVGGAASAVVDGDVSIELIAA